jgi:tRNA(Phe) wybutosine-synthesizing methylase Tyw3
VSVLWTNRDGYLTPSRKRIELAYWMEVRVKRDAMTVPPIGGHGYADPEIYALTDRLNALPGVCTLQSCAGHVVDAADGSGPYHMRASLWLWLSGEMMKRFRAHVWELASYHQLIERVAILYLHGASAEDRREIIDITFAKGEHFEIASGLIGDFFTRLVGRDRGAE